ncbi:hypothetical protein Q4489_00085 [Thalassotalea sp. 1_MG-2023]|uniref:hypothetical protein n=1 Tax=Thalassotalea sp. 1_MG-2023 TaxID=3062680 RepID=UPI0026E24409|nr:hypothetical protein [Thalassotalea sp. 1_MG-2023]MDO6425385.1 hypothetical protein [Thalassotalea sp. 1_MG-2023]
MHSIHILSFLIACTISLTVTADDVSPVTVNKTANFPLLDGHCDSAEWRGATLLQLPANINIHIMHNEHSVFICAQGKAEDYTVLDLYIEHGDTKTLYNLHASAQLLERRLIEQQWSKSDFWNHKEWGGFWVPYAGEESSESGKRTKFLTGSSREIQVQKKKFPGDVWQMMVEISGIYQNGKYGASFTYPKNAIDTNTSTWTTFSFSTH